jgi:hypothetical protein
MDSESQCIKVAVRVRPMSERENADATIPVVNGSQSDGTISLSRGMGGTGPGGHLRQARRPSSHACAHLAPPASSRARAPLTRPARRADEAVVPL